MTENSRKPRALRVRRIFRAALVLVGLVAFAPVRSSVAQSKPIAVYVEGPDANVARTAVIDALPAGVNVVDDRVFRKELARQGQKKPFGRNVDSRSVDRVRRAAGAVGAEAVYLVRVRKAQPRSAFVLVVSSSGQVSADREIRLRVSLKEDDRDELRRGLPNLGEPPASTRNAGESAPAGSTTPEAERPAPADQTNPPPAAPPSPSPGPTPIAGPAPRESPETEATSRVRPAGLTGARAVMTAVAVVAVDGEVAGRRFAYRNGIAPSAFTLTQSAVPAAGIGAELFPLATSGGPWGDVGFVGDYSMMFSPSWAGTNPVGYDGGIRVRIHPGSYPPVLLNITVSYEFRWFGAYDSGRERLPEVTYRSVRPAVDVRIPVGRFSFLAGTALHDFIDPSAISEQFYNPTGIGFDAHVGFTAMFLAHFEARLEASYARYSFTFKPPAGATFGAGGAIDQLYGGQLAIAYVY